VAGQVKPGCITVTLQRGDRGIETSPPVEDLRAQLHELLLALVQTTAAVPLPTASGSVSSSPVVRQTLGRAVLMALPSVEAAECGADPRVAQLLQVCRLQVWHVSYMRVRFMAG
jgi:hypothetical protein